MRKTQTGLPPSFIGAGDQKALNKPLFTALAVFAISIFMLIMIPSQVSAQTPGSWTLNQQQGNVSAYAQITACPGESFSSFLIKFENTEPTITYEVNYTLSVPADPTFPPITGTLILAPATSEEGDCNDKPLEGLRLPCGPGISNLNQLSITYTVK